MLVANFDGSDLALRTQQILLPKSVQFLKISLSNQSFDIPLSNKELRVLGKVDGPREYVSII